MKKNQFIFGSMRIAGLSVEDAYELIKAALEEGITWFDHADIYGGGKSEELFGEVLKLHPELREKLYIQTKCGICRGYYDSSYEHIVESVLNSLKRLNVAYVDRLLIHRPDFLMDTAEMKRAFDYLYQNKLVKSFGVSNMNPLQIELIEKKTGYKMEVNQLQFSIVHSQMVKNDVSFNMNCTNAMDTTQSMLSYCQLHDIEIQCWSPLMASWQDGSFIENPKYPELNNYLAELAEKYKVSKAAIAIAWILRVPTKISVVLGSTKPHRIKDSMQAKNITLTREEWYKLFIVAGNLLP